MGRFFYFNSNCEGSVKFDLFGEIPTELCKNLFTHGYTINIYFTREAVRVRWDVPMGVFPAKCWSYVILTISGKGVVAEVSLEREPPAKSGAYGEAPGGRLLPHGGRVMEATTKRSVITGLKPRRSTIHWNVWYMRLWTAREVVVCKVRRSGSSFTRLHVVTDMPIPYARICILGQQQLVSKGTGCKVAACFPVWPRFLL
jgi:hypothetical protein